MSAVEGNPHFLTLRRNQGQTISTKTNYTTLEAFSFYAENPNRHVFTDFRLHGLDNVKNHAVNIGGGVRFGNPEAKRIHGVNVFFDYRRQRHCSFNQLGLGYELLGNRWNFRLNAYIPLGNRSHLFSSCLCNDYIGDYFIQNEGFMESMGGLDFDIEAILKEFENGEIRLAITPYYFSKEKGCRHRAVGSQVRLTTNFARYFTFTVVASHDSFFKGRVQAQLAITAPFDFLQSTRASYDPTYLRDKMYRPVQRQDLIILKKRHRWTWNY